MALLQSYMKTMECVFAAFYIDGLVPDCSNSITNALELLQSCTKPSISFLNTDGTGNWNFSHGRHTHLFSTVDTMAVDTLATLGAESGHQQPR